MTDDAGVSLESSAKKQLVLIATCHVHWDPEYCDVKLIQTMMFMHRLQNIIKEAQTSLLPPSSSSDCNQIPVILCGDLNSLPESGTLSFSSILYIARKYSVNLYSTYSKKSPMWSMHFGVNILQESTSSIEV